jgi:hypothetical protein
MDEILRKRLERKLDGLTDDRAYQVLDYIEFLESKYGSTARPPSPLERITEGVGDTLRAARAPASAIRGTMNVMDTASRMMRGLATAGRAAVREIADTVTGGTPTPTPAPAAPDVGAAAPEKGTADRPA